ncbi:MAG: hypothetical protein IJF30_03420 [Clostridia bacterium]|nr:hypothetical protein [Clostridia bacterium]
MFGYITVCKDELKIKDYTRYRAYYCGVCHTLGKRYNHIMRLGLSYDLTFLALILDSMVSENTDTQTRGCLKHLGKKHPVVVNCESLKYASDVNVLLSYHKILDDIKDSFSIKSMFLYLIHVLPAKKAGKSQTYLNKSIKENLRKLSEIEKSGTDDIDKASHHFAQIMKDIFYGNDDLEKLGYDLGRYIYLIDAVDDFGKDIKSKNYNPLVAKFGDNKSEAFEFAEQSLLFTLSQGANSYEKLNVLNNKEILYNIIYLGLKQRLYTVLKGNKNEKSL